MIKVVALWYSLVVFNTLYNAYKNLFIKFERTSNKRISVQQHININLICIKEDLLPHIHNFFICIKNTITKKESIELVCTFKSARSKSGKS